MIKIAKIEWLGGHRLRAWFNDGSVGVHDFSWMIKETGPMIEPLHDVALFSRVFVEDGALTWPNGYDAAPAWLHREMAAKGALSHIAAE